MSHARFLNLRIDPNMSILFNGNKLLLFYLFIISQKIKDMLDRTFD